MSRWDGVDISLLKGKTLTRCEQKGSDRIEFTDSEGQDYVLHHQQDCCESVVIEDISGDLADLVGSEILQSEEVSNAGDPGPKGDYEESWTWTFYKLATIKGSVTIRWYGSSSGYYSERVDFDKC